MSWVARDTVLEGGTVQLTAMQRGDIDELRSIAFDREIWEHFVFRIETDGDLERFVEDAVSDNESGRRLVFSIRDVSGGRIVGSMAFGNLAPGERRLEIGWSWLSRAARGTKVNAWSKYLLLDHAFTQLECERVEFKTDVLNVRARAGLRKIGAVEEGTLRSYNFMPGGRRRDAVYYSILRAEWPGVKERSSRYLAKEV